MSRDDGELSKGARSLLAQARGGDEPAAADRERVRRALAVALAGGTAGGAASALASKATASASAGTGAASTGAAGTGAAGTGVAAGAGAASAGVLAGAGGAGLVAKIAIAVVAIGVGSTAIVATRGLVDRSADPTVDRAIDPAVDRVAEQAEAPVASPPSAVPPSAVPPIAVPPVAVPPVTDVVALAPTSPAAELAVAEALLPSNPVVIDPAEPSPVTVGARPAPHRTHVAHASRDPEPEDSTMEAEQRLLRDAARPLLSAESRLAAIDRHAARFPDGNFAPDRERARQAAVRDLCREPARARAYLASHPSGTSADLVRATCASQPTE